MFSAFEDVATLERLSYTGNKSSYSAVAGSIFGQLTPIATSQNTIALKIQGQAHRFITDSGNDIVVGDRLTIDGVAYVARGLQKYRLKSINVLHVYLEEPQNG